MADKLISELTNQALAGDSFFEVESVANVSGSATLTAIKDFIETFIGGQVGNVFADITARDLAAATLKSQEFVEVTDASSDVNVTSGKAWYRFVTGTTFILLFSEESLRDNIATDIQDGKFVFDADTGVPDAYIITLTPAPVAYVAGQIFSFTTPNANTGASTVNVNGLGVRALTNRDGNALVADEIHAGSFNYIGFDGTDFQLLSKDASGKVTPTPVALTDGAAIPFDLGNNFFNIVTLDTFTAAITLTLSNVIKGANQILSVKKKIAGDVTITLVGSGLSFYGYNDAALGVTPDIILNGALDDIFDLSFLARTATEIGVATGLKGN